MLRLLRSTVAAAALAAAAIAVPAAAPASAAACSDGRGVTVVVDPHQLGGALQQVCDSGGAGETAAAIFEEAGFHQDYSANGGMVCHINGEPASDPCRDAPPANAYWSLWWSNGSGSWMYASLGANALKIPAGGSVAWSWQGQSAKAKPGVDPAKAPTSTPSSAPTKAPSAPKPTKRSAPKPAKKPTTKASAVATTAGASPTPSAKATPTQGTTPTAGTSAPAAATADPTSTAVATLSATAWDPSPSTSPTSDGDLDATPAATDSDDGGGLPGWVPPLLVAVLVAAAGGVAWARRAR